MLLRKPRTFGEVYNNLDGEVVNLFRVLRDTAAAGRLIESIRLTPFARAEFELSYETSDDPVERARRLVSRSFMGFGSDGFNRAVKTGFRANSNRSGTVPSRDWANLPGALAGAVERLRGVVIENRDAGATMRRHDGPDTLHYVDPPYMPETRSAKSRRGKVRYHAYVHEMDTAGHMRLAESLGELEGMVVLSGYPSRLYDELYADWPWVERKALADGARERTERLWFNRRAWAARNAAFDFGGAA